MLSVFIFYGIFGKEIYYLLLWLISRSFVDSIRRVGINYRY